MSTKKIKKPFNSSSLGSRRKPGELIISESIIEVEEDTPFGIKS